MTEFLEGQQPSWRGREFFRLRHRAITLHVGGAGVRSDETGGRVLLPIPVHLAEGPPGGRYIGKQDWNQITGAAVFVGMAAVNLPSAIGGRRGLPDRRAGTYPCINLVRSDMKTLLLTTTALAVVCTVGLSP